MEDNLLETDRKRYADDVTVQELVRLRVENERLQQTVSMLAGDRDLYIEEIKQKNAEIERLREALKDKDELVQYLEGHIDGLKKFVVQQKESE